MKYWGTDRNAVGHLHLHKENIVFACALRVGLGYVVLQFTRLVGRVGCFSLSSFSFFFQKKKLKCLVMGKK